MPSNKHRTGQLLLRKAGYSARYRTTIDGEPVRVTVCLETYDKREAQEKLNSLLEKAKYGEDSEEYRAIKQQEEIAHAKKTELENKRKLAAISRTNKMREQRRLCDICNIRKSEHWEHATPISRGGLDEPENLITTCGPCNLSKGRKTIAEFLNMLPTPFTGKSESAKRHWKKRMEEKGWVIIV